jgi:preprotein translocase subunit SecF
MNILKYTKFYLIFSLILLIPGVISLAVKGLNVGIDFSGGSVVQYELLQASESEEAVINEFNNIYTQKGIEVESTTFADATKVVVRAKPIDVQTNEEVKNELLSKYEGLKQISFETVGPAIGKETAAKSFTAMGIATLGILFYIAYAFRNVAKPHSGLRFGAAAIIAMLHDALIVLGVFSILGYFLNVEIDALFITALLTVVGFSVHDTIVVFDRIRENLKKLPSSWGFKEVVNYSLVETLNRSLATSLTVIMVLTSLFLLGGDSIKYFSLALLIGIISGTYSSLFNASPILVLWEERVVKKKK